MPQLNVSFPKELLDYLRANEKNISEALREAYLKAHNLTLEIKSETKVISNGGQELLAEGREQHQPEPSQSQ